MNLPQFALFPNAKARHSTLPEEWEIYLDSWTSLAELYLRLNEQQFESVVLEEPSLTKFLISFFRELANDDSILPKAVPLRKKCFFLIHRIYTGTKIPVELLDWPILSDVSRVFAKSAQFRTLLENLWERRSADIERSLQLAKNSLIKILDSKRPEDAEDNLNKIVPLLRVSSQAGTYMLTGSDFLDSLCSAHPKVTPPLQAKFTTTAYLGLCALLEGPKPNFSLLSDHLYSLKANGEQQLKSSSAPQPLIAYLVTNTPLLNNIREKAIVPEASRVKNFAASLSVFQQSSIARPKKIVRRKVDKGKGKEKAHDNGHGQGTFGDMHIHRMSLVTQVQDLFPDLGSGFVAKLLHEYDDNVEEVTAHLLDDSLPSYLANANRSEQLPTPAAPKQSVPIPRSPPPSFERRNIFDDDDFDKLAVDASRLHIGRRNQQLTADGILSDRTTAPNKAAILSALAAFDSDDDERDDTYDVEDVGGTIDSAALGPDDANVDKNEEALFKAYTSMPEMFARDAETRRGKSRAALKNETGMTDEAIEGWALMIGRDPKRLRRLEAKFSTFVGQQTELASTAWRDSPGGSDTEDVGASGHGHRGGRGRGRGRGRGSGRGGNVAGPTDEKGTQVSRQRKEANKGSRANHNRRDQRARKLARGGFAG